MKYVILLVDDDAGDRELVRYGLEEGGAPVDLRMLEDGEKALEYLAGVGPYADRGAHPLPDLILLDLKMPRRSGFEVLTWARARQEFKELPILVMTSSAESRDVDRAYAAGANSYIVKTADLEQLAASLRSICELAELRARRREGKN